VVHDEVAVACQKCLRYDMVPQKEAAIREQEKNYHDDKEDGGDEGARANGLISKDRSE
jgi:hypothetical protein